MTPLNRRGFLEAAACLTAAGLARPALAQTLVGSQAQARPLPPVALVDYHVHLDNSSIEVVAPLAAERGVRFGIVEHAGTRQNVYPTVLSNDAELIAYVEMLEGHGVYKGIQAEWTDWMHCFSREALSRLDYTLTDTMTFPGHTGERVKLWEDGVEERVDLSNPEAFMDRYVDWNVAILSQQPIDLLVNVSWLPKSMADQYDAFWTKPRIQRVLDAARQFRVAIEISSSFKLPGLAFAKEAKSAGLKFAFGSNGRYPNMGKLDYSRALASELGLSESDFFRPAPPSEKAVERRTW